MAVIPLPFEMKKFCQLHTLSERWDMPIRRIKELAQKGVIRYWHPEGRTAHKGRLVDVASVLEAEQNGYIGTDDA